MKKFLALILALAMVLSLAACGSAGQAAPEKPAETPAAPAEKPADAPKDDGAWSLGVDTIKIGYVGPHTGPSAGMGMSGVEGAQLAVEKINAAGGVGGAMLELVTRDDEADPTKSFTYVEELIYKEEINMLIGAPNSACTAASLDTITENKIIDILCTATSAAIIDPELYPYTFRICSTNDIQAERLVQLAKEGNYSKVVVIGDTSALGIDGFAATEKYAADYGVEIAEYISYTAGDADLSAVANSIKNAGADCVLAWALSGDAAKILKALDRIGHLSACEILGYSGFYSMTFPELLGDLDISNASYLGFNPWAITPGGEKLGDKSQAYYNEFRDRFGAFKADGSGRASTVGDANRVTEAIYLYCAMVEKTQSLDPDLIKAALETDAVNYEVGTYTWEGGYSFSATDHEGYNADQLCKCLCNENPINDYVDGDCYVATE